MIHYPTWLAVFALTITLHLKAISQTWTHVELLQGYSLQDSVVTFLFDPEIYDVDPSRVSITGSFRGWDQTMDDENYELKAEGNVYMLIFDSLPLDRIQPHDEFKYRINDGEWLEPPDDAPNKKGGNLVFMKNVIKHQMKVELRGPRAIWAEISGERPIMANAYRLIGPEGKEIPIQTVLPNTSSKTLLVPAFDIDIRRPHYLEIPSLNLRAVCSYDGWFRKLYSSKELGANISEGKTTIRIFAPRATGMRVFLYHKRHDKEAYLVKEMVQDRDGIWESTFDEDLHGIYYDFTVHGPTDEGNHFYESNPVHITDPYARVSDDTWGKGRIWRKTIPATPLKNGIIAMQDVIAYEVHIQDFTDLLPVEDKIKGTFRAMYTPGLRNELGQKVGFDYLVDLGINTLHLMPVQEYLHFPDDDWRASFSDDPYMIDQGVSKENYQWGYRTSHAFAIESRYRSKGRQPGAEREEFRDLVQAFHDKGIAVIIDIVPNHTAENMDGNDWYFHFNALDKIYYYRTKDFKHIGEYGNEVKTENRPMVQRWLIDQCTQLIAEFGIDGFRIDLAGQIDRQTLKALKAALGPDIIVYGEAWIGSNDPDFEANPDWDWYKHNAPITFFQDDTRNAFKGPVFALNNKYEDRGWAGGKFNERPNVMRGLASKFPDDKTPLSGINYLDIHDNFTLADQFATHNFDGRFGVDQGLYKIATTLLYTSLGPIVTHGGSEIMRTKGHAPLMEVVKETKAGIKVYMHGKRDTYNHRSANQFKWKYVGASPTVDNTKNYKNMHAFWRGMNAFRLSDYGKVFRVAEAVPDDYYRWITPAHQGTLGYIVDNTVFVLLNASNHPFTFEHIHLPGGQWKLIATNKAVDHVHGVQDIGTPSHIPGPTTVSIHLAPESLRIWVKMKD